ncbi:unnamed protein product [Effrenium voratum]|uniref:Protein kinase domain-containing protein n=1 Tax=Effrenium voratum TaxID=2562239 RepID=A0AA36JK18_9DINO|nr:unnamed protein product [Effrenium voratum]
MARPRSRSRTRARKRRKKDEEVPSHGELRDSQRPHFRWKTGQVLGGRYRVKGHLGDGTFGRVLAAKDRETGVRVAVKVIKAAEHLRELAEEEAQVLREIEALAPAKLLGRSALRVRLLDSFLEQENHFCMVFEELGVSLRDFLKRNGRGVFLADAQEMARQLLQGLAELHHIGFIHTDLKCRNVMLRHGGHYVAPHPRETGESMRPHDCSICLIDFGGCVHRDGACGTAGTRQFRSPELVLGLPWDEKVDVWAAGCIIYMLYFGRRAFSVHENMEHLAMMERLTESRLPLWMVQKALAPEDEEEEAALDLEALQQRLGSPPATLRLPEAAATRAEAVRPLSQQVLLRHGSFLQLLQGSRWTPLAAWRPQRR